MSPLSGQPTAGPVAMASDQADFGYGSAEVGPLDGGPAPAINHAVGRRAGMSQPCVWGSQSETGRPFGPIFQRRQSFGRWH